MNSLTSKNINSEEISKIYKTQSSVPSSTSCTGSWPGFSRSPKHGSLVIMSEMDSSPSKTWKMSWIQTFVMTELAKPAKSFFSKCDLDLTKIYEVTWRGSSNIFNGVVCRSHLAKNGENFIEIGRQTPEKLQIFLWGVFFLLPPWFFTCGENLVPMSVNNTRRWCNT